MEVMEDGNLLDRMHILVQRDKAYYDQNQKVLQENLCSGVVGGALDFPHYASFAAVKMVTWFEEHYISIFGAPSGLIHGMAPSKAETGIQNTLKPEDFVTNITSCCSQLLQHLHTLTQEALDHADLQVLTSTMGAAAIVSNALWVYNHHKAKYPADLSLSKYLREYQDMCEALAERLLDLHCRLISLYILQDADCLDWSAHHPFFESERGSFVVQMWWLYMQGTKEDLWTSVPPKTAQRIFAGMLNESLTILSVRYNEAIPSPARSSLVINDICNLLCCAAQLLPALSSGAKELTGEKVEGLAVSTIHDKCHLLLCSLLLKGAPLSKLYKKLSKGLANIEIFKPVQPDFIAPWFAFVTDDIDFSLRSAAQLNEKRAILIELSILNAQPQPPWSLILKVLMMRNCWLAGTMLHHFISHPHYVGSSDVKKCEAFLCNGDCYLPMTSVEQAIVYIVVSVGSKQDISRTLIKVLESKDRSWADFLDRSQIWNQRRPGWLDALIIPLAESLKPAYGVVQLASSEGASIDQQALLSLALMARSVHSLPSGVYSCAKLLEEILPADSHPLADRILVQLLVSAFYTLTLDTPLAEYLCNLEETQLKDLTSAVETAVEVEQPSFNFETSPEGCEIQVSQLLFTQKGKESLKVVYKQLKEENKWLMQALGEPVPTWNTERLLNKMFYIGQKPFDRVLSGEWIPDWDTLLNTPLGISHKFAWEQIQHRLYFADEHASHHDNIVSETIRSVFMSVLDAK